MKKPIVAAAVTAVWVLACTGASTAGNGLPSGGALTGGAGGPVFDSSRQVPGAQVDGAVSVGTVTVIVVPPVS